MSNHTTIVVRKVGRIRIAFGGVGTRGRGKKRALRPGIFGVDPLWHNGTFSDSAAEKLQTARALRTR